MINLNTAFKVRSQLRKEIDEMEGQLRNMKISRPIGQKQGDVLFEGKEPEDLINEISEAMSLLEMISLKIEKANSVEANEIIVKINSTNDLVVVYKKIYDRVMSESLSDIETNHVTGVREEKPRLLLVSPTKYRNILKDLRKEKASLENKLSEANGRAQIDISDIKDQIDRILG
jgi:hypothetical protein